MMGMVLPEICWAYKKYSKIIVASSWFLFFSYPKDARSNKHQSCPAVFNMCLAEV